MKKINQFWAWYDTINELWRMLTCIALISLPMCLSMIGVSMPTIGIILAVILIPVIGTRMCYTYTKNNIKK